MNIIELARRHVGASLARQFVLGVVLVQALLASIFVLDLVSREAALQDDNRRSRAEGVAQMLATSSVSWTLSEDLSGLDELVQSASSMQTLRYAMILTPSGRVLAHTDERRRDMYVADEVGRSLTGARPELRRLATTGEALDIAAPIMANGRHVGWAWVSFTRADIHAATRAAYLKGALYVLLATAVTALIGTLLARHIGRGLAEVAHVAASFRRGERKVRFSGGRYDEIGAVGRRLNDMLDTIVETERSLRTTQQIARIGSWRCRLDNGSLRWSEEVFRLFGLGPTARTPTLAQFMEFLPAEGREMVEAVLDPDRPQERFTFLLPLVRPDGTPRIAWTEGRTEFDADGRMVALVGVCQDVTERESAAAQLRQAQKMEAVGQLTGGLAHDFNNLLSIIVGNLDFIEDELEAGSRAREFSQTALEAALKGSELTRQLLAFSRRQPLAPKVIDLNAVVASMTALLSRTIGESISVRVEQDDGIWTARADPSQVESAILNLVINARDAMPSGGTLTIETGNAQLDAEYAADHPDAAAGDYAVISVSDTGTGMPPDVLAKVFEPFFTTKDVGKGSGLGLSMVYGFAKQSAGHVRIYSEPGHGTTVRLFLPKASAERSTVEADAQPQTLPRSRDETVLVVEDNEPVRRIAVRQLQELGYRVLEAKDGREALSLLRSEPRIHLLFTDVVMPGMSGIELVQEARRDDPALKVLYTTGFTEAAANTSTGFTGSDLLISKPYRKSDLAFRLREALEAA